MSKFLYLVIGGSFGTVSRYLMAGIIYRVWGTGFPYGTMAVNIVGCFLIGLIAAVCERKFLLEPELQLLLLAGFCGAFTTFSTFIVETDNLLRSGEIVKAMFNVVISVVAGFLLFRLGMVLGESI